MRHFHRRDPLSWFIPSKLMQLSRTGVALLMEADVKWEICNH